MKNALFWYPHLFFDSTGRSLFDPVHSQTPVLVCLVIPLGGESYKLQMESLVGVSVEKEPQTAFLRCFFAVPVSSFFVSSQSRSSFVYLIHGLSSEGLGETSNVSMRN